MIELHAEALRPLIGKNVTLGVENGMATIDTHDGWELHIYNAFGLLGDGIAKNPALSTLSLVLEDCRFDHETMVAQFSKGITLTVDLSDDGYFGPGAMQLNGPDGTVVIWN
ncbi:MAG: hypothetical protein GAK31_00999 [Stenotrophomonas maltophilia]|uniref:Uncharacterized protein n=1 Tax=Stenotrophomonas maltophilia TaxID=40324 RepID=A0A7V8FGP0_STEMA|nr:MAG: hypothetical protein GAK31_00999 [Stenotrophomonas maltophilia]